MKLVHSLESVVRRKKSTRYPLPTTHYKVNHGFTLIELLIAITIIAILIGLGTYTWINAQEKGRDGKRKNEMKEVQKALELYAHTYGKYPTAGTNGKIQCNAGTDTTTLEWGSEFICDTTTFMQKLPQDPHTPSGPQYYYEFGSSGDSKTYKISVALENTQDKDLTNLPCTVQSPSYNYCVTNP